MSRRQALRGVAQVLAASPLLKGYQKKFSELSDPLLRQVNVFDFAKVAKAKLDPLAWDYLDEGSDDEASLRANRAELGMHLTQVTPAGSMVAKWKITRERCRNSKPGFRPRKDVASTSFGCSGRT